MKDYSQKFVFYESVKEQIDRVEEAFGIEVAYKVCKAVINYGLYNTQPDKADKQLWACGLEPIMASINAAQQRYDNAVANGKKGGRPKKEVAREVVEAKIAEGWSNRAIAQFVGVSEETLRRRKIEWAEEDAKPQNQETQTKPIPNNITQNQETQTKAVGFDTTKLQNLNNTNNINKNIEEEDFSAADSSLDGEIRELWSSKRK